MIRVLVFSTLYPSGSQPNHGVFVENRLRQTIANGDIEAGVLAPVPFFPMTHSAFGRYAAFARAPHHEVRHGLDVWHPRYAVVPKVGAALTPAALFRAALRQVQRLAGEGRRFDVIDAHYVYPDGVAAARLALVLGLPLVITGRGTDLTLIPEDARARSQILWAAQEAAAMVTVCEDLRRRLIGIGAPAEKAIVLRNGVDLELFRPQDRPAARAALGFEGFTLLSVGGLIPRKGHDLAIEALGRLPDCRLLVAGSGPSRQDLEALARRLGVLDRVRFLGEIPHKELPALYAAADVFVLASSREGWANVLLEAMACGTPVVATNVNGAGEVVRAAAAGLLMPHRTPASLVETLGRLRGAMPARADTRRYAEGFGWKPIGRANAALLTAVAQAGFRGRHTPGLLDPVRRLLAEPPAPYENGKVSVEPAEA